MERKSEKSKRACSSIRDFRVGKITISREFADAAIAMFYFEKVLPLTELSLVDVLGVL